MSGTLGLQTLLDMIGYDTSGLSTQQLDDGFRFMAEFLHPDDAPTLHLCIVNLINTSVAANIMPADFTGIYKGYKGSPKARVTPPTNFPLYYSNTRSLQHKHVEKTVQTTSSTPVWRPYCK